MNPSRLIGVLAVLLSTASAQTRTASVRLSFQQSAGPLEIDRISLGQGGLSDDPMWEDRSAEIRALHPRLIRLFIQEYFSLLPAPGKYHFDTLDRSVDLILRAGAKPLMNIDFKPRALFPVVDQDIVEPRDYKAWEDLVYNLVRHYKQRGAGIQYWEVANEPDIGEDGGCPYRFKPDNYVRYYQHTVAAILRADPAARVGGPALAGWKSPLLPALLDAAAAKQVPLAFVSWHIYNSDPMAVRETIDGVKALLEKHPEIHPETILDEWNMSLSEPVQDPRFQPCFIAETAWQMKEGRLDYSCYYHIRDYPVSWDSFKGFMSPHGVMIMAKWWNLMPQYDGIFDYQNTLRPSYFTFKLLSRLGGERLGVESDDSAVHGLLTHNTAYDLYSLLFWNFSEKPVNVRLQMAGLPGHLVAHRRQLDATAPSNDENIRLKPLADVNVAPGDAPVEAPLDPYAVEYWSIEKPR
jgi:xylan 1,4-beta-xylosidase